jgi:hypothetical protein
MHVYIKYYSNSKMVAFCGNRIVAMGFYSLNNRSALP